MNLYQKLGSVVAGLLLGIGIHSTIDDTAPASLLHHKTHTSPTEDSISAQQDFLAPAYHTYLLANDHPKLTYNSANGITFPITLEEMQAWQLTLDPPDRQQGRKLYPGWADPGEMFGTRHSLATITAPITDAYGTHYFLASGHAFDYVGEAVYATDHSDHIVGYPVAHVVAFVNDSSGDVALVKMDTNQLCQLSWCDHGKIQYSGFQAGIDPVFVGDLLDVRPGRSLASTHDLMHHFIHTFKVTGVEKARIMTGDGKDHSLRHLIITDKNISLPGDSGSPVTNGKGFMVGMLEAGDDEETDFVPIGNALHQLRRISGIPSLHIASIPGGYVDPYLEPDN